MRSSPEAAPLTVDGWLRVVLSEAGPRATVRLVLAAASRHMDWDRPRTFVGTRRLARDTALSTETVTTALAEAEAAGWIERAPLVRGARRELRAALRVCGESGHSTPAEVCGESGHSDAASVRVVSGLTGSSVLIHRPECAIDPA